MVKKLSPRETEIAALLSRGKSQKEIAHILGISYHTVRTHVKNARRRTESDTSIQLAIKYVVATGPPR